MKNKGMSKRIKILFTIPNFDTAGSGRVVYDLVKGLDRTKFEPEICCFHDQGAFFKTIETLEVPIHLFKFASPYKPLLTLPFRVFKIVRFFRKYQFDIIHSWHWSSDFTEPLAAKLAGIPFVYTKKAMGWGNRAWKWRSQLSTKIITINSDMLAFFESMHKKTTPIPLGIDINYFKPLAKSYNTPEGLTFSKDDFVIITVANLAPVKGIEILLEAVRVLNDPRVRVLHIGADDSDYGAMLKSEYGQDSGVYFLGKQLDVRPYLAVCDVFVIPTKNEGEGLPIAPMEAMASSRIVIGSKVSGITDILNPFQDHLFHPGDVTDLKETLVRMMSLNKEQQLVLQHQMRQHIMEAYNIQDFIKNHESLYKGLVK
jgi:glycosyltransferase involved in cell wall biosynthesis